MKMLEPYKLALLLGKEQEWWQKSAADPSLESADWKAFWGAAQRENMDLLALGQMKRSKVNVPETATVQVDTLVETGRYQYRLLELQELRSHLEDIPVILLKGPALMTALGFKSPYKRSIDLDLLVRKRDVRQTIKKLSQHGFQKLDTQSNGEFTLHRPKGTPLDVHYDLTASSPFIYISKIDLKPLFREAELLEGASFKQLSGLHGLVHLVMHFAVNHRFTEFLLLYELHRYLRLNGTKIEEAPLVSFVKNHALGEAFFAVGTLLEMGGASMAPFDKGLFLPEAERQGAVRKFLKQWSVWECLLTGQNNGMETNTFPEFCANTPRKRKRFEQGNRAWFKGKYV